MLLTILVPIGFFINGIIAAIREHDRDYIWWISIVASVLCGGLTLIVTGVIGTAISPNEIIYKETATPIVALEDNITSRGGTFFLGTGANKSDIYYYYMIDTERGYVMKNVKAYDAYIKYDTNPRIVTESGRGFNHWYNYIWAFPTSSHYTIYVPEGTILNNYNIDLK